MNKLLLMNFMLAVLIALQGCSPSDTDYKNTSKPHLTLVERANSLTSKKACEAEGGNWQKVGKLQRAACVLPSNDAGQRCYDSSQCEVACITLKEKVKPGTRVEGQCQGSTNQFGCRTYVSGGVAEPTLCID